MKRSISIKVHCLAFCIIYVFHVYSSVHARGFEKQDIISLAQNSDSVLEFGTDVVFTNRVVEETLQEYINTIIRKREMTIHVALEALTNFDREMRRSEVKSVSPHLLDALVLAGFPKASDIIIKSLKELGKEVVPGLQIINALYFKTISQLVSDTKKQKTAVKQRSIVHWVKDQSEILTTALQHEPDREEIRRQILRDFLKHRNVDRFQVELISAKTRLKSIIVPAYVLEKSYYEQWINSQFKKTLPEVGKANGSCGCIEIRMTFEKKGQLEDLVYDSSAVLALNGRNIADAVNKMIDDKTEVNSILELDVQKRVCVRLNLSQGAKRWFCAWFNRANALVREPSMRKVRKILQDGLWQLMIKKFKY